MQEQPRVTDLVPQTPPPFERNELASCVQWAFFNHRLSAFSQNRGRRRQQPPPLTSGAPAGSRSTPKGCPPQTQASS
eukprot:7490742-Lingulodinium_polyedra.AAC.1